MQITVFLVGTDANDALGNLIFDSQESAEDYAIDNPGTRIFAAEVELDFSTVREVV